MILLFLALGCFSATILMQKYVLLAGTPVMGFVALRTFAPGCLIFLFELLSGRGQETKKIFTPYFFLLTCITTLVPLFLKNLAHKNMPSAKFALLSSLDPFITCILMYLLFGQTIKLLQLCGILCAVCGTILLSGFQLQATNVNPLFVFLGWPEIAALVAVALGRLGWIAGGQFIKTHKFSEAQINILFMLLPGILAVGIAGYTGQLRAIATQTKMIEWLAIISSISFNTAGCILMTSCLSQVSAVTISLAGTSIIPLSVALGSLKIYNELLSINFFLAGVMIFLGLAIFFGTSEKKPMSL